MRILVLGGGTSPEREVSLRSAKAVANAARQAGYEVDEADPRAGYKILDNLPNDILVFPILHGADGEDGVLQVEMDKRQLAYLGSGAISSKNCFDKRKTREILVKAGIQMPLAELVNQDTYEANPLAQKPHVLKILHGGSSIGTLKADKPGDLTQKQIEDIFNLENSALIEELIEGTEITIPILGDKALPVIEIIPPANEEFDYENKYNGRTQELCPPKNVFERVQRESQALAENVHQNMGCRHLSRVDIMIDKDNNLFVLEINTMPGMTDQSLYPRSANVVGLPMPELVNKFVSFVKLDYGL